MFKSFREWCYLALDLLMMRFSNLLNMLKLSQLHVMKWNVPFSMSETFLCMLSLLIHCLVLAHNLAYIFPKYRVRQTGLPISWIELRFIWFHELGKSSWFKYKFYCLASLLYLLFGHDGWSRPNFIIFLRWIWWDMILEIHFDL